MTTLDVFHWLQDSAAGTFLRTSNHLVVEFTEVFHVLGLVLMLASLLLVNLRLLGIGLTRQPITLVARSAAPMVWIGMGITLFSGTVLFLSAAMNYYGNPAFWPKLGLLVLAVLVQLTLYRSITGTDTPHPLAAKITALLSLTLWFGVGFAGRAIGYV
jgi:hypothetical protein